MGKPSELYSEISGDGKLIYHLEFFFRQSTDILMLRHEDYYVEKIVF
jgi:hypothetical protein